MDVQQEILLTPEDIAFISNKAQYSLMMHNPGIIAQFTKNWWDVMHITPFKKLLFIQGHQFTGLEHINRRHRYYTNEHSPVKGGFVITSKFSPDSGTLPDYSKLAEFLYDEKHKVMERNKRPELFDVYQAKVEFKDRSEFCLIVYKDSRIIHTLFPIQKNKPVREYRKQDYFIEYSEPGYIRGFIPYTDTKDNLKFAIGVRMIMTEKKESWVGLIYGNDNKLVATIEFGEMKIEYKWGYENRIEVLNFADLTKHEDVILNFIKKDGL
jgi:hypothetical protein